ncbi:MAG: tRNA dihydrouridine synthase [Bacteroidota bacterium]
MHTDRTANFWHQTQHPLLILAPMEDVTDTAFRELVMRISQPGQLHVLYTEFTSTDGLCHPVGRPRVEQRLKVSQSERELLQKNNIKLVAQIWGNNPEKYAEAVKYITTEFKFDAIDINMGCPVRNVVAQGSCSALIDNEPLAGEIIAATREATHLPVSVKTRLGVKKIDTERWITFLLQQPIDALILHGRTQKQMSEGEARWDEIAKAVNLRNQMAPHIRLIGNGDVLTRDDAQKRINESGADGAMIGRGIFANPWLFNPGKDHVATEEKLETLLLHLSLFEKNWGNEKPFVILRRFFKIYLNGFPGASALRSAMMSVNGFDEARRIIRDFQEYQSKNTREENDKPLIPEISSME